MKLLGIVVGLLALCMFVGSTYAKEKGAKGGKGDMVVGRVSAVNVDADGKGTITIKKPGKKGADGAAPAPEEITITTDASTVFTIDGAAGKGSDISVGMMVKASPATGTAKTVDATAKKPAGSKKAK